MKKIISFLFVVSFISSCCQQPICETTIKQKQRLYKEVICPKCEGTGTVPQTTAQKVGFAICSFGMTLMCDDEQMCPKCHGTGYIKVPILNDSLIIVE